MTVGHAWDVGTFLSTTEARSLTSATHSPLPECTDWTNRAKWNEWSGRTAKGELLGMDDWSSSSLIGPRYIRWTLPVHLKGSTACVLARMCRVPGLVWFHDRNWRIRVKTGEVKPHKFYSFPHWFTSTQRNKVKTTLQCYCQAWLHLTFNW